MKLDSNSKILIAGGQSFGSFHGKITKRISKYGENCNL